MLILLTQFIFILAGALAGFQVAAEFGWPNQIFNRNIAIITYMTIGSAIGYVLGGISGRRFSRFLTRIEGTLQEIPITELILGTVGLAAGLVLSYLITLPFALLETVSVRLAATIPVYIFLAWLGTRLGSVRRAELRNALNLNLTSPAVSSTSTSVIGDKLLDTNIIIDGRIMDIVRTGFLEGEMIVPRFVLHELQTIADSESSLKRARGRRGLEILNSLQIDFNLKMRIEETDYPEIVGVDAKLIQLAKETGAAIITNDYNLSKVAQFEGIKILNLNDLANSVKAVVMPGELLLTKIIREGKESGQGIGYLEDGTMVVVEGGLSHIGQTLDVEVTSVLQTPSGRMIFTKLKASAKL